jgi:hypothetical protein
VNPQHEPNESPINAEAKPSKQTLGQRKKSIQKIGEDPHKAFSAFSGTRIGFLELLTNGLRAAWNPAKKTKALKRPPQTDMNADRTPPPIP